MELLVSVAVHLLFGLYILSTAVASDLSQAATDCFRPSTFNFAAAAADREGRAGKTAVLAHSPQPPIVLVHGIFGFGKGRLGGLSYFAGAEKKDDRVLVPDLGSLTSVHDRARELFYYLKGGQVDYGEEHSRIYGHSRFGRIYEEGHYPLWDEHNPIHFVGHSAGVQVVRVLQQMLADKAFSGHDTSDEWVLSITSLSGALNGTTRTYFDGMQLEDGRAMKSICLLQILRWAFRFWGLDPTRLNNSRHAHGKFRSPNLPNTYYFSYATKRTRKFLGLTIPASVLGIHPLLFLRVLQMCLWRYPTNVPPPYKGYRDEDWEDNDGALNTISMTHPRLPIEHPSHFVVDESECHPLQPGIWYYKIIEADHILFIVNRERAGVQFDLLYDGIFQRCRKHVFRTSPVALPNQSKR
uniref:Lipase-like C-terminal domain-containing protein n=1 Tax=Ananas comosus var. bracteatus TaxID=296719 RepID=A0A6V7PSC7_ANACO|nr:unnamed protein product [Ananas comosus var. bracteatus]